MSSTLTLTLQDAIDVAYVILGHCAAVSGCRAGTGGQHTVARVTGGPQTGKTAAGASDSGAGGVATRGWCR
jgi:hypothetical protein